MAPNGRRMAGWDLSRRVRNLTGGGVGAAARLGSRLPMCGHKPTVPCSTGTGVSSGKLAKTKERDSNSASTGLEVVLKGHLTTSGTVPPVDNSPVFGRP